MPRPDGRTNDQLRPLVLERHANPYAEGSCLIRMGGTLVHCTASGGDRRPGFKKGTGEGWVTAEYAMLPRATVERTSRERNGPGGRTQEIQRLIGRSLRAAMATMAFGEHTIWIDCDVLEADGGTRTASITGGCVALVDACAWLAGRTGAPSPSGSCGGGSVGVVDGEERLDLAYVEDKDADVDCQPGHARAARFVEVQGTGEHDSFSRAQLDTCSTWPTRASRSCSEAQRQALGLVKLLAATRSKGKQVELRRLLEPAGIEVMFPDDAGLWESPAEEGLELAESFEGNARRKAEHFARLSGRPTVADDSGLEVFSLGGAPGVRSRRWAGAEGTPSRWMPPTTPSSCAGCAVPRRPSGGPATGACSCT